MKVMIDTNIILDVLYKREDFYEDSLNIFRLCETKTIIGYISTLSILRNPFKTATKLSTN